MSAATRTAIAAAVNAVEGVNVTAYRRQQLTPYEGFVHLVRRVKPGNRLGWMDTWQVWIALPQDVAAAEAWTDTALPALLEAADDELIVTSAFPAELQTAPGAPTVPGLVIEGAREG